ncbi:unnamed protein product [Paramecium primaurelia]|uniref:cathepsin L n=1 Tax=Paramecium primaurelia TaxID=5886 RepID=A0A8S1MD52_PARPR|nr:unnamed protein product [Paramecium primaurelia]
MKQYLAIVLVTLLMTVGYYNVSEDNKSDFEVWITQNNKFYTETEKMYRMEIYYSNKRMIQEHNLRDDVTYKMSENQFMALTHEEFVDLYLQKNVNIPMDKIEVNIPEVQLEGLTAVDWRNYSTVKNQGICHSGYAFSVSNSIEAWYGIMKYQKIYPSTQQIVDCDFNSSGCYGGYNGYAMEYAFRVGLSSNQTYPYVDREQNCKQTRNGTYFISGYSFVGGSQQQLQQSLSKYPVSVGINADNWQFYGSGVFYNCSSNATTHYALAVGFDNESNWIVQNSWGSDWGEKGHIRLYQQNTCGILNYPWQIY